MSHKERPNVTDVHDDQGLGKTGSPGGDGS